MKETDQAKARRPEWKGPRKQILARLPAPLADGLRAAAAREGQPVNDLVTDLVRDFVGENRR